MKVSVFAAWFVLIVSVILLTGIRAHAVDSTWTSTVDNNLNLNTNWSNSTLPSAGTGNAFFTGGTVTNLQLTDNFSAGRYDWLEPITSAYTYTGPFTLSVGNSATTGILSHAAKFDVTFDTNQLDIYRAATIVTGDYNISSADRGTGNIVFGHNGGSMVLRLAVGTGAAPKLIANNGTSIIAYSKVDLSGSTNTSSNFHLLLQPTAGSTIAFLGGITMGPSPVARNPGRVVITQGETGGKVILGDSADWTGITQVTTSDLEINSSNSLGAAGDASVSYTEIQPGTNTGSLRLTNNINSPETIFIYGRTTTNNPQIRNISGNNTLSGNILTDANVTGIAMISSDAVGAGNSLTVQGNIQRTGSGDGSLILMGAGNGTVNGVIGQTDIGVWTDVQKSGAGIWTLTNANTYTGSTTVSAGKLVLSSTGSIASTSAINVKGGATFDYSAIPGSTIALTSSQSLAGAGNLVGSITAAANTIIAPGDSGAGVLAISGSLGLNDSILQMQLSNSVAGVNDKISLGGALTANGVTTIAVTPINGVLGTGTYNLIDYSGPAVNTANFSLTGVVLSPRTTSATLSSVANHLNLVVVGGPANLTWVGGNNGDSWDVGSTANNWSGAADNRFFDGDIVTFSNTGTTSPNVNGTVTPGSVSFTNSTGHDYTIGGGGTINVSGNLTSSGSGSATFANSSVAVSGNVTKSGTGDLNFSSFGGTTVAGNVVADGGGAINISNATFATTGNFSTAGAANVNITGSDFTVGGSLALNGSGTVTLANFGTFSAQNGIAINSGTLAFNMGSGVTISSPISGTGQIAQQGFNIVTLGGNNSGFNGSINVASGTIQAGLKNANSIGTATVTVADGATFDLNAAKMLSGVVSIAGNGVDGLGAIVDYSGLGSADGNRSQLKGIILTADASIGTAPNTYPYIDGANVSFQGNGHNLTVNGTGEWDIQNVGETHLANITLNDGQTQFNGTTTLGDAPGVVTLNNNGYLGLDTAPVVTKPIIVGSGNGGIVSWNSNNTIASQVTISGGTNFEGLPENFVNNSTQTLTIDGQITGDGTLSAHTYNRGVASRLGVVALTSNSNNYTGATTIGGGGGFSGVAAADDHITLSVGNGGSTGVLGPSDVFNNGTLQFNRNDTFTVANNISGTGNVTAVAANGVVTLTGPNTYSGTTTISAGKLLVNGTHTGGGNYTVASGATLGGIGQIDSNVVVNASGFLAPGTGIGTFAVGGATIAGTLKVEYNGAASTIDLLTVNGALDITAASIDFSNLSATALSNGTYVFASYGTLTGTSFSSVTGLPSGFAINYAYNGNELALIHAVPGDFNGDGNVNGADFGIWQTSFPTTNGGNLGTGDADGDGDIDGADFIVWQTHYPTGAQTAAVPEPMGFVLAAIGGLGLLLASKRRKAA